MVFTHQYLGLVLVWLFLLIALWGLAGWLRNRDPSALFWRGVAAAQIGLGLQVVVGIFLYLVGGRRPPILHYAYGLFPILVMFAAHRISRRLTGLEWAVFSFAGLVNFGLLLRAYMTGFPV